MPQSQAAFSCLWQWLSRPGMERFSLFQNGAGWSLNGTIVTLHEGTAVEVHYRIDCDGEWRTRSAAIELAIGQSSRELKLAVDDSRWSANGVDVLDVRGCVDIDLGWSPSTNMLPIRRLNLVIGQDSGVISAAWVKFPELTVEPLAQRYEHLAQDLYRFSSRDGSFAANIAVDAEGVPVEYAGLWRRVH